MKILILKPSSLGDVIQALPVLRLLKLRFPSSRIFWWISNDLKSLLQDDPDLEGLFPFERHRWARPAHWKELLGSWRDMRAFRFDWVIDLQGLARSGLFAWLANGNLTIGLDDSREGARGFYDVAVPRPGYHAHAVDWYLAVLNRLQVPVHAHFRWMPENRKASTALRKKWNPEPGRWVALCPGARWLTKRWPLSHFQELIRMLTNEFPDLRVAVLGSGEDQPLAAALCEERPKHCLNLAGKTNLQEMIEWVRFCDFMITNDTGPMHIAAAMGKPVLPIFGPTEPRRTGPYGQIDQAIRVHLPCSPCLKTTCRNSNHLECMHSIKAPAVLQRARDILKHFEEIGGHQK